MVIFGADIVEIAGLLITGIGLMEIVKGLIPSFWEKLQGWFKLLVSLGVLGLVAIVFAFLPEVVSLILFLLAMYKLAYKAIAALPNKIIESFANKV